MFNRLRFTPNQASTLGRSPIKFTLTSSLGPRSIKGGRGKWHSFSSNVTHLVTPTNILQTKVWVELRVGRDANPSHYYSGGVRIDNKRGGRPSVPGEYCAIARCVATMQSVFGPCLPKHLDYFPLTMGLGDGNRGHSITRPPKADVGSPSY